LPTCFLLPLTKPIELLFAKSGNGGLKGGHAGKSQGHSGVSHAAILLAQRGDRLAVTVRLSGRSGKRGAAVCRRLHDRERAKTETQGPLRGIREWAVCPLLNDCVLLLCDFPAWPPARETSQQAVPRAAWRSRRGCDRPGRADPSARSIRRASTSGSWSETLY
jgi:hypothetical protein